MRVLICSDTFLPTRSGIVRACLNLGSALVGAGHEVLGLVPADAAGGSEEMRDLALPIEAIPSTRLRLISPRRFARPRATRDVAKTVLDHFRPDVVHVHTPWVVGRAALRAAAEREIPSALTVHLAAVNVTEHTPIARVTPTLTTKMLERAYRDAGSLSARISAPSDAGAQNAALFFPTRAVDVVSNGVSDLPANNRPAEGSGATRVLYVGRLVREKHLDTLIRAVGSQALRHTVRLQLIGDGSERGHLERLAQDTAAPAEFTGYVSDLELSKRLANADIFCMPSDVELECIAVLEALAFGVPVVAPTGSAIDELTSNSGAVTRYADANDAVALAEAITAAICAQQLDRIGVATRCRSLVAERTLANVGARWCEIYSEMTEIRRRASPAAAIETTAT